MNSGVHAKHGSSLLLKLFIALSLATALISLSIFNSADANSKSETETGEAYSPEPMYAPFASTGSTSLYTLQGSGASTDNGDYVTSTGGMNTMYRYFVEVPSGLSQLNLDIFDADIGAGSGEASAGRDRARSGFNTSVQYSVFDPSGTQRQTQFTTGNTTSPTGADNAWLTLFRSGNGNTVRDNFGTAAYNNNDGNNNWATNWDEVNDGTDSATAGEIQINGGQLRVGNASGGSLPSINREADLSGTPGLNLTDAFLIFTFSTSGNLESSDTIVVEASSNGGSSFTTLETFSDDSSGSRTYNITSYIANNTRIRFRITGGYDGNGGGEIFSVDNLRIEDTGTATAGHWEIRVDMTSAVTGGDDINAIGIRAHDGTSGSGGTELNVYYDSHNGFGVNPPTSGTQSRSYETYPYISSGCSCSKNDFDYDSNSGTVGSLNFTSRTASYTQNFASSTLSTNDSWDRDTFSGWTSDSNSSDYGIWNGDLTITSYIVGGTPNGNYTNFYMGNFQAAANPPTANPTSNTFRVYLPTDSGAAPVKPYVEQLLRYLSGSNPATTNQTTTFTVTVRVINPTSNSITFSSSNLVTANVPGSGATYAGIPSVNQGTVISQADEPSLHPWNDPQRHARSTTFDLLRRIALPARTGDNPCSSNACARS